MRGGSSKEKAMRKGACKEVAPVALTGALLSSGKDFALSLQKTKGSESPSTAWAIRRQTWRPTLD
jgi:hypothetical protein